MAIKRQDATLWFPSLYLSAADLNGREVTLTIRDVKTERVRHSKGEDECNILFFEEARAKAKASGRKEKRLIVRKATWRVLIEKLGKWTDQWEGKRITLYTEPAFNPSLQRMADAIRVRETLPPQDVKTSPDDLSESDEVEDQELNDPEAVTATEEN